MSRQKGYSGEISRGNRSSVVTSTPICSWVVAYAYAKIGYRFGVSPRVATPDDIDDWIKANPKEWTQVYPPPPAHSTGLT